jgi:lipid A 3-O-deacylase
MKYLFYLFFFTISTTYSQNGGVYLTHDNDIFARNNNDENYTGGIKIDAVLPCINTKWMPFYRYKNDGSFSVFRMGIGITAYTPEDLTNTAPDTNDRPYASLVFLSVGATGYNPAKNVMLHSELFIGSIGTSIAGNGQSYIHENGWLGSERPVPLGWDNQIGYPGSLIINYITRLEKLIGEGKSYYDNFSLLQGKWVVKADLGNYMINLQGGIRLNFINYHVSPTLDNAGSTGVIKFTDAQKKDLAETGKVGNPHQYRFLRANLFAEPSVRYAAYNATLEGLMFNDNSVYKIEHSDVSRFLFEINAGVNVLLGDLVYLRYIYSGRTREYSGGKSYHNWGSICLGATF